MIPLFSQSELGRFFVDTSFVVPITILTIIIGIPLSWNIIENYKIVMIPVKKRGSERPGYIVSRHIVWILIVLTTVLLVLFFVARELRWQPCIQYIIYPVFFLNLFATFSLLLASAMERSRYENDQATTPYRILRTLERNGLVQPRIKVIENMIEQDSDFIQTKLNIQNEPGVRLVTVEVDGERISAILTHDLSQLLRKIEPSNDKKS